MRLTGLASGLDIDSMVKELMKAEQSKYDNMVKDQTRLEWKQEDYRTMAAAIVDFRNNKLQSYNLSNTIDAKTSEVAGDTNAVTVNAVGASAAGSLNVVVSKVATAESQVYNFSTDKAKTMSELGFTSTDPNNSNNVLVTINGVSVSVAKTDHLKDLASAINSNSSKVKATALYDETSGKFSITATQTGATTATGQNILNLADGNVFTAARKDDDLSKEGQDAEITVNGIEFKQASNKFQVNGFDFTVKAKTETDEISTISAVQDTDKIIDTIKSFVNDYNTLIGAINSKLSEKKNYDFNPLTQDEKDALSDDEVKLYEQKARSGDLANDDSLSKLISELRTATTSLVSGIKDASGKSISIGITTGSYTDKGKLVLDESKLRSALESNPDEVVSLFSSTSSDTSPTSKTAGVFNKMMDSSMDALKSLSTIAGTSTSSTDLTASFLENSLLSEQIRDMKDREKVEQDRLNDVENQYYATFSAMETSINQYNSQASSIAGLFQ